ncbi:MAG: hypothetical protein GF317_09220 [Candidatus Lokiarchaeota archaeon]|nr:hypothetical protein [Candidatus Lokiarchaeota archaeon]MBD3199891.1 hypothetical protein [Candidatus Lokiarchaeota archaeon]
MERQDSKGKIIREVYPSEVVSIIGSLAAGIILTLLILPFQTFSILIIIVPALLSLRGNISGPFIARSSRDLIIGVFDFRNWLQNVAATYALSIITSILIGILAMILNLTVFKLFIIPHYLLILIPCISMLMSISVSMPTSTLLNYLAFKFGFDPNNVVNPLMTAVDDFFSVVSFYLTLILLGVP